MLSPFLEEGTDEHETLQEVIGRSLASDSEELAALAELGARQVRQVMLRDAYDRAIDNDAFDETATVVRANRSRRRPSGA